MASGEERAKQLSRRLSTGATSCFMYFVAALLFMHLAVPKYTPLDHMISDYAVGPYGWIMTTAFLSASAGCVMLAIAMFRVGPATWPARAGAALLIVMFAGLIVSAAFPTDLETALPTRTGDIHTFSFLVNVVSGMLASVLLGISYGSTAHWHSHRTVGLLLAALLVAAFVAQFLTLHPGAPYGIANRVFVALFMTWLITTSVWARRAA